MDNLPIKFYVFACPAQKIILVLPNKKVGKTAKTT